MVEKKESFPAVIGINNSTNDDSIIMIRLKVLKLEGILVNRMRCRDFKKKSCYPVEPSKMKAIVAISPPFNNKDTISSSINDNDNNNEQKLTTTTTTNLSQTLVVSSSFHKLQQMTYVAVWNDNDNDNDNDGDDSNDDKSSVPISFKTNPTTDKPKSIEFVIGMVDADAVAADNDPNNVLTLPFGVATLPMSGRYNNEGSIILDLPVLSFADAAIKAKENDKKRNPSLLFEEVFLNKNVKIIIIEERTRKEFEAVYKIDTNTTTLKVCLEVLHDKEEEINTTINNINDDNKEKVEEVSSRSVNSKDGYNITVEKKETTLTMNAEENTIATTTTIPTEKKGNTNEKEENERKLEVIDCYNSSNDKEYNNTRFNSTKQLIMRNTEDTTTMASSISSKFGGGGEREESEFFDVPSVINSSSDKNCYFMEDDYYGEEAAGDVSALTPMISNAMMSTMIDETTKKSVTGKKLVINSPTGTATTTETMTTYYDNNSLETLDIFDDAKEEQNVENNNFASSLEREKRKPKISPEEDNDTASLLALVNNINKIDSNDYYDYRGTHNNQNGNDIDYVDIKRRQQRQKQKQKQRSNFTYSNYSFSSSTGCFNSWNDAKTKKENFKRYDKPSLFNISTDRLDSIVKKKINEKNKLKQNATMNFQKIIDSARRSDNKNNIILCCSASTVSTTSSSSNKMEEKKKKSRNTSSAIINNEDEYDTLEEGTDVGTGDDTDLDTYATMEEDNSVVLCKGKEEEKKKKVLYIDDESYEEDDIRTFVKWANTTIRDSSAFRWIQRIILCQPTEVKFKETIILGDVESKAIPSTGDTIMHVLKI